MAVLISDDLLRSAHVSDDELRREIAVMLYGSNKLTLGQASEFCNLSQFEFQNILGDRHIPMHYDTEEFARDLTILDSMRSASRTSGLWVPAD